MGDWIAGLKMPATYPERVAAFAAICFVVALSMAMAHDADLRTIADPAFRDVVQPGSSKLGFKGQYLYGPSAFGLFAVFASGLALLPRSWREKHFYEVAAPTKLACLWLVLWTLLTALGTFVQVTSALRVALAS